MKQVSLEMFLKCCLTTTITNVNWQWVPSRWRWNGESSVSKSETGPWSNEVASWFDQEFYQTAPFSVTLNDPKPRFQGRIILWRWMSPKWLKIRPSYFRRRIGSHTQALKWYQFSMTLSDLWPTFQGHDNILYQRQITRLIVSHVWCTQRFRFQWSWVTLNQDFNVTRLS